MKRHEGKVALITGSTTGLGRGIALRLASEGARIVVNGRNAERGAQVVEEIRQLGSDAIFLKADIGDEGEIRGLIQGAVDHFGKVDTLVNNAAAIDAIQMDKPCADLPSETFDRIVKVQIYGTFWACKYVLPAMIANGGGNIVNISSNGGWSGVADIFGYCSSKSALAGITQSIALDYGLKGVRCNCVLPGYVRDGAVGSAMFDDPVTGPIFASLVSTGKIGSPADIGAMVAFLTSDDAQYITGQLMHVDGGASARLPAPSGFSAGLPEGIG